MAVLQSRFLCYADTVHAVNLFCVLNKQQYWGSYIYKSNLFRVYNLLSYFFLQSNLLQLLLHFEIITFKIINFFNFVTLSLLLAFQ